MADGSYALVETKGPATPMPRLWLVMGLIQEQMKPEQVAAMESHMPPPVREFWTTQGRSQFEAYVADLRA